jgi:hypothetical protein
MLVDLERPSVNLVKTHKNQRAISLILNQCSVTNYCLATVSNSDYNFTK